MKKLLIAAALALLAACTVPVDDRGALVVVQNSEGGNIEPVQARIAKMQRAGQRAVVAPDFCWSSCTMYLAVAECVGPETKFGFHGAMTDWYTPSDYWTKVLAGYYSPKLYDWYMTTRASNYSPFGIVPLSGKQVSALTDIRLCTEKEIQNAYYL